MKSESVHIISPSVVARVTIYASPEALRNYGLVLLQDGVTEEGVFTPPQSVFIPGQCIPALRALLANLPNE